MSSQTQENEIAFFNSGDIYYVVASPNSERYVYQFDLNFFNDVLTMDSDFDLAQVFNQLERISAFWPTRAQQKVVKILLTIASEHDQQEVGYEFAIEGLMYKLVTVIIRELPKKKHVTTQLSQIKSKQILETLNQVFKFVEDNYTHRVLLEDAAAVSNFSEYYFTRFFKRNVGQTFLEFLNDYRLDKAKRILISTDLSITEVLTRTGFSNNKTFYRLFKKRIGMTPKQYRKQYSLSD